MLDTDLRQRITSICPDVSKEVREDFFTRMDEDYFYAFSAEEIAAHIRIAASLSPKDRLRVKIDASGEGEFDIVIIGFDYLSEFATFCGLLSAFGLDIRAGEIYSFAKSNSPRSSPRKIVDVFRVGQKPGEVFDEIKQREFEKELLTFGQLLATGSTDEARERLNRFLIERIETMHEPLTGLVHPTEIRFDNTVSSEWTLLEAQSEDAFALLYAISNALAMQGIYIHKVKIAGEGHLAKDRFFIADRWGHKIQDEAQQDRLRTAVAMIKQFTRFLPEAPDAAKAMRHFDQLLDKIAEDRFPAHAMLFLAREEGMSLLARLLGSSDYLWDDLLGVHIQELLPMLERFAERDAPTSTFTKDAFRSELRSRLAHAPTFEEKKRSLNRFKDDQVFLVDVHHLLDPLVSLLDFSQALTDLAEVVVDEAVRVCSEHAAAAARGVFTVCALGKFGGREMGYASDLELLFVHEERESGSSWFFDSLAHQVVEFIEARSNAIFQIDLRLRPYGDAGAWSVPFDEVKRYYSPTGPAVAFERQALIKLRWVAGDEALGRRVEEQRDSFSYGGTSWDGQNALHLRQRQMRELVKPGEINVKYSAGGIIDIEYAVQYLQLTHGKDRPEVRAPNTLEGLEALHRLKIISKPEYEVLHAAYLFLRNLIDALRIVRGNSSDLLLPDDHSEEFKSLARRLGYREHDRAAAARRLSAEVNQWMKSVHEVFVARFGSGA